MLENIGYGKDSIKLGFTKHMQCVHIYFANITMVSASTVSPSLNLEFLCTYKNQKLSEHKDETYESISNS